MPSKEQIKEITEKLEDGIKGLFSSDRYRDFLKTMGRFHSYSFNNNVLISMQKPDATYVAGYNSWKKNFGRHVNKGEKAIRIIAPAPYKKVVEAPVTDQNGKKKFDTEGKPITEKKVIVVPGFKVSHVYDISQTSGRELPNICNALDGGFERFDDFKEAISRYSPVYICYKDTGSTANGYYSMTDRYITVQTGMSEGQTIKTAIHEVAHSILHDEELGSDPDVDLETKEVQAESVAYTVCQHYGLDTSDYSFGYIAGWSSDRSLKELRSSMETIRQTANDMINGIDMQLKAIEKEKALDSSEEYSIPIIELSM